MAAVVALGSIGGSAIAQNATTNDSLTASTLYSVCRDSDTTGTNDGLCNTYFRGLTDGLYVMEQMHLHGRRTCMPGGEAVSNADARHMFNGYMATHPQDAGRSAGLIAAMAVILSFPCPAAN